MGLFTGTTFHDLGDLYRAQLRDLYDAEQRVAEVLPRMQEKAGDARLKHSFGDQITETQAQIARLEKAFTLLGETAKGQTCEATRGLIKEAEETLDADGEGHVLDAALIANAQRIQHYNIAGYGCLTHFAKRCGQEEASSLFAESADEAGASDRRMTQIAEERVNAEAAAA
ncbi:ferritin-like domain-containing protein [Alienimonas sp. DA493]|uniref:YciE/YciF ferroxidase family protein n=1 Tax=Alienimonas sp. DA493 TaxID=3373605 RepID=UPI00375425E7